MLDKPFMDEVHASTYHGMIPGAHKHPGHRNVMASFRQSLRRAQRFIIDDDAVRLACRLSHDKNRTELWSILARLPFDTVWIEFDLHEKVREWERMNTLAHPFVPEKVSRACGYLLRSDLDSPTRWVAHEFVMPEEKSGEIHGPLTQPCAMIFDPEGSGLRPVRGSTLLNEPTLGHRPDFPKLPVTIMTGGTPMSPERVIETTTYVDAEFGFAGLFEPDGEGSITAPQWVHHKVGIVPDPVWSTWVTDQRKLREVMLMDIRERTGALKWLITMLAVINDVPKNVRSVHGQPGRKATRQGPIKYLDHHVVSIKVPKRPLIHWAKRELDKAATTAQRAWHRVRGHWRITEYGKPRILCKHLPSEVLNGVATCLRCQRQIRWISPHERGDPMLGMVDHSYSVEGS